MRIKIVSPTKALVQGSSEEMDSLRKQLTYKDLAVSYDLKRITKNHYYKNSSPIKWKAECDRLKALVFKTLIFEENGLSYIRPGSIPYLKDLVLEIEDLVVYPKPKKIPWNKPPQYLLYPYQADMVRLGIQQKHANGDICTGGGKTLAMLTMVRELGLPTVISTPNSSIFNEILKSAELHFGKGKVGAYGDGKKRLGKLVTVCISKSLSMLKEKSPEYDFFHKIQVLIGDENHTLAAESLENICHGVFSEVPYRFFFSGSPTRGDGSEKLLQSIIGKTVVTLTTKDAVDGGFICPHNYKIVQVKESDPNLSVTDPLEVKRIHYLRNRNICEFIAKFCNIMASKGEQVLVLVEELNQIAMLLPKLDVSTAIAHSEKSPVRLAELGLYKVDTAESVDTFNKREAMVLAGTGCISTGTNIYSMRHTINWQAGSSTVKTKQGSVGRSVRLWSSNPYKEKCGPKDICTIWDFDVYDNEILSRHLESRISVYNESGPDLIKYVKLK